MTIERSYAEAAQNLGQLLDEALDNRETVIIRRDGERVALIAADELESYRETVYLLRSPANAGRLLEALRESLEGTTTRADLHDLRATLDGSGADSSQ
jgi:antitoxin YefM